MTITGYKYNTEDDAITARNLVDAYKGYPKSNGTTLHWVDYVFSSEDNFWYIESEDGIDSILGSPSSIDITIPTR